MFYHSIAVNCKPGKRFQALDQLKAFAEMMTTETNTRCRVAISVTGGPIYQAFVVAAADSLAQLYGDYQAMATTEAFRDWFEGTADMIEWPSSNGFSWRVYKPEETTVDPNAPFLGIFFVDLIPGQAEAGRMHLRKLAEHSQTAYGIPAIVFGAEDGSAYRHAIAVPYQSLEQYDEIIAATNTDEVYGQWVQDALSLMKMETLETAVYHYI